MVHTAMIVALSLCVSPQPPAADKPPEKPAPANVPDPVAPGPAAQPSVKGARAGGPLVAFPHPLITEILFAVPTGEKGDANGDGTRDTSGDEFVELVNPHDKPIQLNGYVICGKAGPPEAKSFTQLKFTFPPLELKPSEVAVVFNGHGQKWEGPVGDTARAPEKGSDKFHGARVFTMAVSSARVGFVNKADYVLLTAPGGEKVQCIKWGDSHPPKDCPLVEEVPAVSGQSLERRSAGVPMEPHPEVDGRRFSPGRWPLYSGATGPAVQITPAPPGVQPPKK